MMSTATDSMTAVTPKAKLGTTNEEEGERTTSAGWR